MNRKILISFLFLILFNNNIYASCFIDNVSFSQTSEQKIIFDRGDGCSTVELPEASVNALWKEILNKGFSADEILSDQPENINRQTLDQNNILLTNPDTKAGDVVIKEEIPSKLMNPLEVPTILGQSCYGPYEFGINLKDTLRVGRCAGNNENSECYLTELGLYRQNGMSGFFKEVKTTTKDALVGIKDTILSVGSLDDNKLYNENLGAFSNVSSNEINNYLATMSANDINSIDIESWNINTDKMIQNSTLTNNFSVSMQTTCRGENCYINKYSLFDKMYNQYFSLDMVVSATSPFILNGMAKIVNHPSIKKQILRPHKALRDKKIIKEGGFFDTLMKDPALFIKDPFGRVKQSFDAAKYSKKDVDTFILNKFEPLQEITKRDYQHYDIQEQVNALLSSTQDSPKKTGEFALNQIINNKDIRADQKRVFTDIAQIYGNNLSSANGYLKLKMDDPNFKSAKKVIDEVLSNNGVISDAYNKLTRAQLDAYRDVAYSASQLADGYNKAAMSTFKWKTGFENAPVVLSKNQEVFNGVNLYKSSSDLSTVKLFEVGDNKSAIFNDFDPFRYKISGDSYDLKGMSNLEIQKNVVETLADNSTVSVNRVKSLLYAPDRSNIITNMKYNEIEATISAYPNGFVRFFDSKDNIFKEVRGIDWNPNTYTSARIIDIDYFPQASNQFIDDVVYDFGGNIGLKKISDVLGEGYYDLDALETMQHVVNTVPSKINDTARNFDEIYKTLSNKEWVSGRGRDALDQFNRVYNGAAYQRLLTANPITFGINFAYWELKTMGASIFGTDNGLSKYAMYQLPETYSALHIKHKENAEIYDDSYIDFFANDGSDEGDLFKAFMNSAANWTLFLVKEVSSSFAAEWSTSFNNVLRNVTEGKIKRSKTDDIVLVSSNLSNNCKDRCNYIIGSEYVEQATKNASMLMELEEEKIKNNNSKNEKDTTNEQDNTTEEQDTNENENKSLIEKVEENVFGETSLKSKKVSLDKVTIMTYTPADVTTINYVLENTSEENLKKNGQTLITFSHHTDYDGTFSNQTSEKAVDLLDARNNEETCGQVIEALNVGGVTIGSVIPKTMRNHRIAGAIILEQKLAYTVFPGSGYFSSFLAPALASDVPQMFLIAPQLHNCVDDEEGSYAHFYVSSLETERVSKDSKNKVGDAVKSGVTKVEESLSKITEGTELEKGVKFGAEQIKDFTEQKLEEHPIVQSTYRTSGDTTSSLASQLFFFEMGPKTKCNAIGYNDKGVEKLVDNDTNISLTIDKSEGEMTVIDENGNVKTIIGKENKDFVRLISTNLGIPAKIIPRSLSYIPVSNNTSVLFDIDGYGNLSVKDVDFFNCLRAGYEAQTGLTIPSNAANLTEYLGVVKVGNVINPSSNYILMPQGTQIIAEGTPRILTTGNNPKAIILNNRITKISPVNTEERVIGQNVAIQFEFGQLIYSEEKQAYIFWVETTTATHGNDISSLKTELVTEKAINGCDEVDEVGLNFIVSPEKDNAQAKANTDKLNKAFEKVGPFKMFDTETKTFIFYVSDPPECEQRLKIIDKQTGEVTDQKITDIQQTPTGLVVKTNDGKSHNLEFSSENGVPMVTYNGEKETLLSAQGNNGSFWYDPDTGNWYTTNGNLIPFNDKFKEGVTFAVNPNGLVTGAPGNNVFNIGSGGSGSGSGGFNIPLAPENKVVFMLYILIIYLAFMFIYSKKE